MSRILVVDDDPDFRNLVGAYLKGEGYTLEFADSGVTGIQAAARAVPDLILTDFQMPQMDGFALFNAVRADPQTARIPVVMFTVHHSRALMLKALSMGLDDFLGKPLTRDELLAVVAPLVPSPTPRAARPAPVTRTLTAARAESFGSVACCEICRLEAFMLQLNKAELTEVLDQFRGAVAQAVQEDGGWLVKFKVHHLLMGFSGETAAGDHAVRAVRCALKVVLAAQRLKPWIVRRFGGRNLPEFLVAVGIHSGTIQARAPRAGGKVEPKGEAAEVAAQLAASIPTLRWSVAASQAAARAANFQFLAGRAAKLSLPGGDELEAVEVKGFRPQAAAPAAAAPDRSSTLVEAAIDRNATLVTYATAMPKKPAAPPVAPRKEPTSPAAAPIAAPVPKAAAPRPPPAPVAKASPRTASKSIPKPGPRPTPAPEPAPPPMDPFAGRRVALKLSDNGVVAVTLVNPEDGGPPQVVKAILINDDKKGTKREQLRKFVDQYAAMQAIAHPNIARIVDRGLTATHLFVIQEYCPGGDLNNLIAQKMSAGEALKTLLRVASGLKAAHQGGFVHGDLRPANVLIREDGSIAVVDFALASAIEYAIGEGDSGVMLRSPEYLSPETLNGQPADVRSDIYTLGLLFHEMLTGQRAYASPDLSKVMMDQLNAPVPTLPALHEKFQPLLDKLMAKKLPERFASVGEVISFMSGGKWGQI